MIRIIIAIICASGALFSTALLMRPTDLATQVPISSPSLIKIEPIDPWVTFNDRTGYLADSRPSDSVSSALGRGGRFRVHIAAEVPHFNRMAFSFVPLNGCDPQDFVFDELTASESKLPILSAIGRRYTALGTIVKEWTASNSVGTWQFIIPQGAQLTIKRVSLSQYSLMPLPGLLMVILAFAVPVVTFGAFGVGGIKTTSAVGLLGNVVVCGIHVVGVLLLASIGHNFDMDSWEIVGSLANDGRSIYANTFRWPYGLPGAYVLAGVMQLHDWLRLAHRESFHMLLAELLCAFNMCLATIIARTWGSRSSRIYLVLPPAILLTGYHSQIDSVAITFGLAAWYVYTKRDGHHSSKAAFVSALLMILSLCIKHVMAFLPLCWFLSAQFGSFRRRLFYVSTVYLLFILHFGLSFGNQQDRKGIVKNVVQYNGWVLANNGLMPEVLTGSVSPAVGRLALNWHVCNALWLIGVMGALAMTVRRKREIVPLVYLIAIVALSPTIADQYLAIPLIACSIFYRDIFAQMFVIWTTVWLQCSQYNIGQLVWSSEELHRFHEIPLIGSAYMSQLVLLVFLLSVLWRNKISRPAPQSGDVT